ncbi:hypothetical protein [Streptomyces sp. NPDC052496]|uniref:hypothetical protein n=1 Tax=Streptomyces sp. NPDC052496 TaxID=3154951 RepID=UPI00341CAB8D
MTRAEQAEGITEDGAAPDRAPREVSQLRQLAAASVGNAVEWYDWFPCTDAQAAYLSAPDLHQRRSA